MNGRRVRRLADGRWAGSRRTALVVGLDCADPKLLFEHYAPVMPCLSALRQSGVWGRLRSCTPPITVPAWACMLTGADPGELGLYGFRLREPGSYRLRLATSGDLHARSIADLVSEAGGSVVLLGVPLSWPPRAQRGVVVSGCLTPSTDEGWIEPRGLGPWLEAQCGPYRIDLPAAERQERSADTVAALMAMMRQRFTMARALKERVDPDLLFMVDISVDRLHHLFWDCLDPSHPAFPGDPRFRGLGERFFAALDRELQALVDCYSDAQVLVVSDHGAQPLMGGVQVNRWLQRHGWLHVSDGAIDWARTRAWCVAGYYGRVWLNLEGRDPAGVVPAHRYAAERAALAALLAELPLPGAATAGPVEVHRPDALYRRVRGLAPDLLVFIDGLRHRVLADLGAGPLYEASGGRYAEHCNHAMQGLFVSAGPALRARGEARGLSLYQVAPHLAKVLQLEPTARMRHSAAVESMLHPQAPSPDGAASRSPS